MKLFAELLLDRVVELQALRDRLGFKLRSNDVEYRTRVRELIYKIEEHISYLADLSTEYSKIKIRLINAMKAKLKHIPPIKQTRHSKRHFPLQN
jgi:hypothetical protein